MTKARLLFQSLRPYQWVKNGFILVPLIFSLRVFHYPSLLKSFMAFSVFCLLTGAIYLINDLVDLEADRSHPSKKDRPLAAGRISPRLAKVTAGILLLFSLLSGSLLDVGFFLVIIIYVAIQALYNYRLKKDGFVFRILKADAKEPNSMYEPNCEKHRKRPDKNQQQLEVVVNV